MGYHFHDMQRLEGCALTILWDWNGTLLDDAELSLALENELFAENGYRHVDMEEYRRRFCFPVKDYYLAIGVKEEDFYPIAGIWAERYQTASAACGLTPHAAETVRRFHDAGFRQVILSASHRDVLRMQVARYPELDDMFDELVGLSDVYAGSKVQMALDFLRRDGVDPAQAVFLGDTLHDAEVAAAIGCPCLLIAQGHQCPEVLARAGVPVLNDLSEAADLLLTNEESK